jgi:hypothetical protein
LLLLLLPQVMLQHVWWWCWHQCESWQKWESVQRLQQQLWVAVECEVSSELELPAAAAVVAAELRVAVACRCRRHCCLDVYQSQQLLLLC